jgi:hypothetical protein
MSDDAADDQICKFLGCICLQICEAFSANRYPFPEDPSRQRQMNAEVTARLRELQTTIEAGRLC